MSRKKIFAISFALILLVMSFLVTRAEDGCDPVVNNAAQGDALYAAGNYAGAVSAYNCALQTRPDSAALYNARGNAYRHLENYAQAIVDYNRAIEIAPSVAMFYNNRGFAEYKLGSFTPALTDLNRALELDPNLAYAYNNRGLIYADQGQNDLAAADFSQAITLGHDPLSWPLRNLDALHVDVPTAGVLSVNVNPPVIPPEQEEIYEAAQEAYHAGDYDKSVSLYTQLIEIDPESHLYYCGRAAAYYAQGDYQRAVDDFTESIKRQPTAFVLLWRGNSYAMLKQTDKALSDYADALRIEPTSLNPYLYRSLLYHQISDDDLSREDFKQWMAGNGGQFVHQETPKSGETITLNMENYHFYSFSVPVKKGQVLTIETSTAPDSKVDPMLVLVESGIPQVVDDDGVALSNAAITQFVVPGDCVYDLYLTHPGTPGPLGLTITISDS